MKEQLPVVGCQLSVGLRAFTACLRCARRLSSLMGRLPCFRAGSQLQNPAQIFPRRSRLLLLLSDLPVNRPARVLFLSACDQEIRCRASQHESPDGAGFAGTEKY